MRAERAHLVHSRLHSVYIHSQKLLRPHHKRWRMLNRQPLTVGVTVAHLHVRQRVVQSAVWSIKIASETGNAPVCMLCQWRRRRQGPLWNGRNVRRTPLTVANISCTRACRRPHNTEGWVRVERTTGWWCHIGPQIIHVSTPSPRRLYVSCRCLRIGCHFRSREHVQPCTGNPSLAPKNNEYAKQNDQNGKGDAQA